MAESCSLKAHVRNSKGEVVESKLFNDLLSYTSSRPLTKQWYAVGTNPDIIKSLGRKAKFDENGELTVQTLIDHAGLDIKEENILSSLNKEINAGSYVFEEALQRIQGFNESHQMNQKYLATLERNQKGEYNISVVKKSVDAIEKLQKAIQDKVLIDKLTSRLNRLGVSVNFLTSPKSSWRGRYSTENAKQTAESLMSLIDVVEGKEVGSVLAEETGHFIVGAMDGHPLLNRLMDSLTEDDAKQIIGDKYSAVQNVRREAAGMLIGQALEKQLDKQNFLSQLIDRLLNIVKKTFSSLRKNDIQADILTAQKAAENIAHHFMSEKFDGTLQSALQFKETLYSSSNFLPSQYYKTIAAMRNMVNKIKILNYKNFETYNNMLLNLEATHTKQIEHGTSALFVDAAVLDGLKMALEQIQKLSEPSGFIDTKLKTISTKDSTAFWRNAQTNAKTLLELNAYIKYATQTLDTLHTVINSSAAASSLLPTDIDKLREIQGKVTAAVAVQARNIYDLEQKFFLQYLANQLGDKFIYNSARKLWGTEKDPKELNAIVKKNKARINHLFTSTPSQRELEEVLSSLDPDLDMVEYLFFSLSESNDVILQTVDRMAKNAHKEADDNTWETQDMMRAFREKFNKLKNPVPMRTFFEKITNDDGNEVLSGNFITPYHWGQWEKDRQKFKEECFEEFKKQYPNYMDEPVCVREYMWGEFLRPRMKIFHEGDATHPAHSTRDENTGIIYPFVPNAINVLTTKNYVDYTNKQYQALKASNPEAVKWLEEYMEYYAQLIDSTIGRHNMPTFRIPQMKESFIYKIANKLEDKQGFLSAVGSSIGEFLREKFCVDSDDSEYGSMQTYNTLKEDPFQDEFAAEYEYINRLPLYGINKLKNQTDVSTDIFHSTVAFASMAHSYKANSKIMSFLEVGKNALYARRRTEGKDSASSTERTGNTSLAYKRYLKFLDKQVYGIGVAPASESLKTFIDFITAFFKGIPDVNNTDEDPNKKKTKVMARKVAGAMTRAGSMLFLGGNVAGGLVNLLTGNNELLKEAIGGEHFTLKDWALANKIYFQHVMPMAANSMAESLNFKTVDDDPLGMLLDRWNITGDSATMQKEWSTRWDKISGLFGDMLYMPYKSGEHYMQAISYIALAINTKVYDESGRSMNLLEAYKQGYVTTDSNQKTIMMTHDAEKYTILKELLHKLEPYYKAAQANSTQKMSIPLTMDMFSEKTKQFLIDNHINVANDIKTTYENLYAMQSQNNKFYKERDGKQKEDFLRNLLENVSRGKTLADLSTEEQDYLKANNIEIGTDSKRKEAIFTLNQKLGDLFYTKNDESKFMDKARAINNRLHGIYNNQDKTAFHQNLFGNMLLSMRGYALGMIERRFGKNKWNDSLGHYTEGTKITAYKVLLYGIRSNDNMSPKENFVKFVKSLGLLFLPYSNNMRQFAKNAGFDDNQYANMRRNAADNYMIAVLQILKFLLAPVKGGDDDDDNYQLKGLLYYFVTRLLREQSAFNTIWGFWQEKDSIFSLEPTGVSAMGTMGKMLILGYGALTAEEDDSRYFYQRTENGHEAGDSKFKVQLLRMLPYYRSKRVWDDGYEAAKSYEFGRRVK